MKQIVLAYIPVIHEGYRSFLEKHKNIDLLGIFSESIVASFSPLHKDIRGLPPSIVASTIRSWGEIPEVAVVEKEDLERVRQAGELVTMPDEDISRTVAQEHLSGLPVTFDPVFLRWHTDNVLARRDPIPQGISVSNSDLHRTLIGAAALESERSSDWWRHIGAVAVRDGEILIGSYNKHIPSPHLPYAFGDPRMFFKRGSMIHLSTASHAERRIIAHAAREGIRLEGADLYVTVFPCPPCAKQVAEAGFRRCFYRSGYAMLDGDSVLRQHGIDIIRVE